MVIDQMTWRHGCRRFIVWQGCHINETEGFGYFAQSK